MNFRTIEIPDDGSFYLTNEIFGIESIDDSGTINYLKTENDKNIKRYKIITSVPEPYIQTTEDIIIKNVNDMGKLRHIKPNVILSFSGGGDKSVLRLVGQDPKDMNELYGLDEISFSTINKNPNGYVVNTINNTIDVVNKTSSSVYVNKIDFFRFTTQKKYVKDSRLEDVKYIVENVDNYCFILDKEYYLTDKDFNIISGPLSHSFDVLSDEILFVGVYDVNNVVVVYNDYMDKMCVRTLNNSGEQIIDEDSNNSMMLVSNEELVKIKYATQIITPPPFDPNDPMFY